MTTVACDHMSMAADSMATDGCSRSSVTKIHRLPDGSLVGLAGALTECFDLLAWIKGQWAGDEPPCVSEAGALVLRPDGTIWLYDGYLRPYPLDDAFCAIGTGGPVAMGALHMGATAAEAVEVAMRIDPNTGGRIHHLELAA